MMRHFQQGTIALAIALSANAMAHDAEEIKTAPADTSTSHLVVVPEPQRMLHFIGATGLSIGGDTLATTYFTNGDKEHIKAGGLFYIASGLSLEFPSTPWSVQALLGYHADGSSADNGEVTFERGTLDAQVFYRSGDHRVGVGLVEHFSTEYSQNLFGQPDDVNARFDNAHGLSLEYNWLPLKFDWPLPQSSLGLSLRGVVIDYDLKSVNGQPPAASKSFSGNHVAAGLYLYL